MLTGPTIDVYDRKEFLHVINDAVPVIPAKSAVVTVEMTKRRLTPDAPFPPGVRDDLLASTERLLTLARETGVSVIHVLSALRPVEARARANTRVARAWAAVGESPSPYGPVPDESVDVQDGTFKPDFAISVDEGDFIIKTKKSLSAFYQTDLEWLTKALGVDTLILAGANTNADIQSTAYDASCKAYKVITVRECVATWFGEDLQELGLQQLARCQGWVLGLDELAAKLKAASAETEAAT
ncbi:cysteine hydrolase [Thermopolyspora sp. NPDC052614]|uniref:cysteine hydrolase n=1 Tax=Thermopolyspora sp. NPDC052614 TaxID=3155682 RepID=UPI003433AD7E